MKTQLTALAAILLVTGAHAQFTDILTEGEADIDVFYSSDEGWELSIFDEANNRELELDTTLIYAGESARGVRPPGSQWDFLGVGAGEPLWVLPQVEDPTLPYLGVGSEEMSGTTFDSYFENDRRVNADGRWISLSVKAVRGPGQFAIWETGPNGDPVVWAASADGLTAIDKVIGAEGGHRHFNWGFTSTGLYEVDLVASAFLNGQRIESDTVTVNFGVEAVPEPATLAALALGLATLRKRRS